MNLPKFTTPEKVRTYIYEGGYTFAVLGVDALEITKSGYHKLETTDGKKYIVAPGWIAIEIDVPSWSV